MLSDILSDISSDVLSDISPGILFGASPDSLSRIQSDIPSDILSAIQADIPCGILSYIVSVKTTFCLAYLPGFFLAGLSPVASVLTCFLTFALTLFLAYVRTFFLTIWDVLTFCHFFWHSSGNSPDILPDIHSDIFWHLLPQSLSGISSDNLFFWWRSGSEHWAQTIAVEARHKTLGEGRKEGRGEGRKAGRKEGRNWEEVADIQVNNPHLTMRNKANVIWCFVGLRAEGPKHCSGFLVG